MGIKFKIGNISINENAPPVIIAEIGINHNGSLDLAIAIADKAIQSGAEIIKHQTHVIDDEMSEEAKRVIPGNSTFSIYDIMKKCALEESDEKKLMQYIKSRRKIFISSPFSRKAADRLGKFNVPAFKIGSGECNNYHFIKYICKFKKPIILSTGMNSINSIKKSVQIIQKNKIPLALLHCTNIYPTPPKLVRLDCLRQLKEAYPKSIIGISDHTETNHTSLAAVALGARIIEKHFVDTKKRKGPDVSCSMDPKDLRDMIKGSQIIFSARGGIKKPLLEEKKTIAFAMPSVASLKDINVGEKLNYNNIFLKRPSGGDFGIDDLKKLYGRRVKKKIKKNTQIKKKFLI
ncbi:N-acetylneuraminate synthase family protein [Candidatus Pelagibacter bacterium]|nr:N-acetylneuraminate synthase family protein [Candidatus Pelagibacter bacterium]